VHRLADPLTFHRTGSRLTASSSSMHRGGCDFVLRPCQPTTCLAERRDRADKTEH
jgi:hypothetical protein